MPHMKPQTHKERTATEEPPWIGPIFRKYYKIEKYSGE